MYNYGWNGLDVPINLMFNFCRVSSLACCIKDGDTIAKAKKEGKEVDLKPREQVYAIEQVPSFFDFFSYLYFCGAAISGPWYEYKDFKQMINKEGNFKDVPSTVKPALIRYVQSWTCVATGSILAQFIEETFPLSEKFLNEYNLF